MLSAANSEGLPAEEPAETIRTRPLAAAVWLLAVFSLAGLPLLGSFPGRLALLDGVAAASPLAAASSLIGSLGLLAAGVRLLLFSLESAHREKRQWVEEAEPAPVRAEASDLSNPYVWVFTAVAMTSLLGFGLLPRLFLSAVPGLAALFSQLSP
jgi:formate hydrogenlyase subunit 3/multisubunit Na+/H+ antiporter MnhD subunit